MRVEMQAKSLISILHFLVFSDNHFFFYNLLIDRLDGSKYYRKSTQLLLFMLALQIHLVKDLLFNCYGSLVLFILIRNKSLSV